MGPVSVLAPQPWKLRVRRRSACIFRKRSGWLLCYMAKLFVSSISQEVVYEMMISSGEQFSMEVSTQIRRHDFASKSWEWVCSGSNWFIIMYSWLSFSKYSIGHSDGTNKTFYGPLDIPLSDLWLSASRLILFHIGLSFVSVCLISGLASSKRLFIYPCIVEACFWRLIYAD